MYIHVILPTKLLFCDILISCSVDMQLILLTSEQSFEVIFSAHVHHFRWRFIF